MTRLDLYAHVHKAVRLLQFDALVGLGRADLARAAGLAAPLAALRRMIRLTRTHARHEEREIHPLLHRLAPGLAAELEAGHDRFEGLERELERDLARIESAGSAAERESLGRRVQERLVALVADHLLHMAQEESRANRVLWAHLNDDELRAVQERAVAALEPSERSEWLELMLATGNGAECAALLEAAPSAGATA